MERIKNIREEKDLKQKDMANIIGIKRSTYASYETCRDTIPLKHLNTLCNYFNISLDYALGLTDIKRYDIPAANPNLSFVPKTENEELEDFAVEWVKNHQIDDLEEPETYSDC